MSGLITILFKMKRGRSECVEIGIFSQILGIFGINKIQNGNRTQMKYDTISYWLMGRFLRLVSSILSHEKKLLLRKRSCSKLVETVISSQILGVFGTLKFNWQRYPIFK